MMLLSKVEKGVKLSETSKTRAVKNKMVRLMLGHKDTDAQMDCHEITACLEA